MKPPHRRDDSSPAGHCGRESSQRVSTRQCPLFDLEALGPGPANHRTTAIDRRFVIDAVRDIYRLSNEPHIRQIAEDVLFAHRIPTEEEPSS